MRAVRAPGSLLAFWCLSALGCAVAPPEPRAPHGPGPPASLAASARYVVVVGCDGMSPDGVQKARTPVMHRLMREGAYTLHARGVLPTDSSPNWASMIMGAGPEEHGVTSNDWKPDKFEIPPIAVGPGGIFPTIFGVLRAQRPSSVIACFHDWDDFGRLVEKGVCDRIEDAKGPEDAVKRAVAYFKEKKPDFTFVHLDHVDHAGHEKGHGTPEYYAAVEEADRLLGEVMEGLREAGMLNETVILVTADHGGKGKKHGGATMAELEIPWIIWGPGIARGREIASPVKTYDTAATLAHVFGLERPAAWIARPVLEAFEIRGVGLPWQVTRPIASVKKELYKAHQKPGAAALVSVSYVGPGLEREEIHAWEIRDDVPSDPQRRFSSDNGRSWSPFEPLPPTLSNPKGVEVWEGGGAKEFDPTAGVLVDVWLRQIAASGLYNNFTYYRASRDQGKTWSAPKQLVYEEGQPFDPADPLQPGFLRKNQAYYGSNILRHSSGTIIHCVAHANAPGDPENDKRPWRMGSLCFLGKWDADIRDYRWTSGARVEVSPEVSSRGLMEPELAELKDGRILVVWRGSNTPKTPGRKWYSTSIDRGLTLGPVRELTYDDGSSFYSPSSFHRMIRHTVSKRLYWIGNISAVPPSGNSPRYPLVIAEVDESMPAIRRSTVTAIAGREEGQSEAVQFSNFSLLENRESHELELYLTPYGADAANVFSADNYRYTLTLK